MDYEKKYNEALERAKELSKTITGANYEYIFPELKESEDERIRELCKVLVRICFINELCTKEDNDECMAWIEKQGKNNMGISEATKQKLEDNLNKALEKETPESWNEFLDKQGKQKELNLVEILKHYPRETELYSPLYGKLWLAEVDEENEIITCYKYPLDEGCTRAILEQENTISFYSNGTTGLPDCTISKDCMLFLYNKNQSEQKPVEWSEEDYDYVMYI